MYLCVLIWSSLTSCYLMDDINAFVFVTIVRCDIELSDG